jgi:polyribonucleotide nucleotidyltransferase
MDAGVPITDMVAGIGVGLIADENFEKQLIMTDLAYMEDAFGLLDFKMTGTRTGVTAIQCDMKVPGLPIELIPRIIEQSKEGRMHVLDLMEKLISKPRENVSQYAPKTVSLKIDPDKIGAVIGSGGKVIKEIQEKTNTEVSIEEDGTVVVSSVNLEDSKKAAEIIANMTKDVKAGEIYDGIVEEVVDFGAFVEILPGKVGLLHVSEVSNEYVNDVNEVLKAGDPVKVKVLEVSRDGKMSLSKRALEEGYVEGSSRGRGDRNERSGRNDRGGRKPFNRGHNNRN